MRGCFVDWVDLKGTYQELGMPLHDFILVTPTNDSLHRIHTMGEVQGDLAECMSLELVLSCFFIFLVEYGLFLIEGKKERGGITELAQSVEDVCAREGVRHFLHGLDLHSYICGVI